MIVDFQSRVAFKALRRVRGVEVEYLPHDGARPFTRTMVPGSADEDEYADDSASLTREWLDFGDELAAELGRRPEQDDRIRLVTTRETYVVAAMGDPRPWRPSGQHGGVIRVRTLLTED